MPSQVEAALQIDEAVAVLILRPQGAVSSDAPCKRHLLEDSDAVELLGVDFSTPPATWYENWCALLGEEPANAAVITTDDLAAFGPDEQETPYSVETVGSPSNLTGVGVKSTPHLNDWENPSVVVESLTVLLQYADPPAVYRFLHVLTSRLAATGGTGQFYLDPLAQDEQTVELLTTLFDAVVEYDEEWTVRTRHD
ncbi:MAG: hypothetical protein ABEI27_02065 [Halobellus sp.]|uniref:DUF7504 family protein n=1 Tax=Halobellus sp. TaxID=1979212 RepID=UPI0035D50E66